jgi:hypothetical protein
LQRGFAHARMIDGAYGFDAQNPCNGCKLSAKIAVSIILVSIAMRSRLRPTVSRIALVLNAPFVLLSVHMLLLDYRAERVYCGVAWVWWWLFRGLGVYLTYDTQLGHGVCGFTRCIRPADDEKESY